MSSTIDGVKNTFSSWDSCMSKTYCKWPVIAAIILGSLIALSFIWCCVRCLCCGMQCCCGVCACCNACCPSPRNHKSHNHGGGGYQQAPPTPFGGQYQAPMPMNTGYYGAGGGMRGGGVASTATFDTPGRKVHEDSLPAMPSWDTATSRRVEHTEPEEDVELEKLPPGYKQQEVGLLAHSSDARARDERYGYSGRQEEGDLGAGGMYANPYQDYAGGYGQQQQMNPYGGVAAAASAQRSPNPYGAAAQRSPDPYTQTGGGYGSHQQPYGSSIASPVANTPSPYGSSAAAGGGYGSATANNPYGSSNDYYSSGQQQQPQGYGYESRGYAAPSIAAPSYHITQQQYQSPQDLGSSPVSPPPVGSQQQYQAFGRKPVGGGSWREV